MDVESNKSIEIETEQIDSCQGLWWGVGGVG
jgi:hypothetical protein